MALSGADKREIATILRNFGDAFMQRQREGQAIADPTQNLLQNALVNLQAQQRLQAFSDRPVQALRPEDRIMDELLSTALVPEKRKKAMTKFNRAVKEGMKIVKSSKSYGKAKTINNPKKAFKAVTKTVSKARKGGKLAAKGVLRKVGQKAKQILGKEVQLRKKGKRPAAYYGGFKR